jgi:hypothetical protein
MLAATVMEMGMILKCFVLVVVILPVLETFLKSMRSISFALLSGSRKSPSAISFVFRDGGCTKPFGVFGRT